MITQSRAVHEPPKIYAVLGIQPRGGFVEKEHVWLVNEAEGDVETATLTTRVCDHSPVGEIGEVEDGRQLLGTAAHIHEVSPVQPSLKNEVLHASGQVVRATQLADVSDPLAYVLRLANNVEARHHCLSGIY
jgi:hypothetical protein